MRAVAWVALFLAGLLVVPTSVQSAPADLTILNQALVRLRTRHWNPSLDMPAIVRAGVAGLNRALARAGVTQRIDPIPEGADEPATMAAFGQRLDEAVRVAGGRVAERDLLYAALRSMFGRVGGSHTAFVACPRRYASGQCIPSSLLVGIGVILGRDVDQWILAEVAPKGPAARAGVRRGDALLRIADIVVGDLTGDEVAAMILGTPGTQVRLTLRRGTKELRVNVTRATVSWPPEGKMLGDGIAYLRIYDFPGEAQAQIIRNPFAQLLQAQPRGLVLDLRSNRGGGLAGLVLLGLFVPQGTRMAQGINRERKVTFYATKDVPIAPTLPLTVLINRHTRSIGEVVAGAFKETGRASLIGERTVGAGEFGETLSLEDGSSVRIAFERVLTAQGRGIEGRGVSPDVEFPHDLAADRDLLLERAVQLLLRRLR